MVLAVVLAALVPEGDLAVMLRVLDLFSGIGGFSLGLERAGMRTVAFCEIDPYCRRVLAERWPGVPIHPDVRKLSGPDIGAIDVICGGFPCQPFSRAGEQLGGEDHRNLWPEYFRLIKECRPSWVLGENVIGIEDLALDDVLADLESEGYQARTFDIPACSLGADHERRRLWIVADAPGERLQGRQQERTGERVEALLETTLWGHLPAPYVCRGDDGIPDRAHRLHALGNSVVPQIPEIIGRAIMNLEAA